MEEKAAVAAEESARERRFMEEKAALAAEESARERRFMEEKAAAAAEESSRTAMQANQFAQVGAAVEADRISVRGRPHSEQGPAPASSTNGKNLSPTRRDIIASRRARNRHLRPVTPSRATTPRPPPPGPPAGPPPGPPAVSRPGPPAGPPPARTARQEERRPAAPPRPATSTNASVNATAVPPRPATTTNASARAAARNRYARHKRMMQQGQGS